MAQLQTTEAEIKRDFAGFLRKIGQGEGVVVDQNGQPIASIRATNQEPRTLSELIELADRREKTRGYEIRLDKDYATDVEQIVAKRKPWVPGSWD